MTLCEFELSSSRRVQWSRKCEESSWAVKQARPIALALCRPFPERLGSVTPFSPHARLAHQATKACNYLSSNASYLAFMPLHAHSALGAKPGLTPGFCTSIATGIRCWELVNQDRKIAIEPVSDIEKGGLGNAGEVEEEFFS